MESRAKLLGHPIHPMLIPFPLGLLATAVIFDIVYLVMHAPAIATSAYYIIAAGIIGGLLAAPFGLMDWLAIPAKTRAKSIGLAHGLGNVVVLAAFAASWWLRRKAATAAVPFDPSSLALVFSFAGFALAGVTGWLGGELVDRLGVGVDDGAHLDAPNSLTRRPAGGRS
ncbi:MAG TPA: DUF2231 domain-containing protein [Candidatus Limnocylindrales bacterium]|nr:DUF2231 domain-containing protein [Candidatus Limnocylindrales bacterium]